jgi:hypothetical protein
VVLDLPDAAPHCAAAYVEFLQRDPDLLAWLCRTARDVYTLAPSNVRSGLDYTMQERKWEHIFDIALRNALVKLGRRFEGERLLHISSRSGEGLPLHAGRVPFHRPEWILQPGLQHWWQPDSIACFWQSNKVLQVRQEGESPSNRI